MKTAFLFSLISIFTIFLVSTSFAQDKLNEDPNNIRNNKSGTVIKIDGTTAINDKVEFKNETGNAILTITDEGRERASITLPSGSNLITNKDKLYNVSGSLYFSGTKLSTSAGANEIDGLNDAASDGSSVFLGDGSGISDNGSNNNTGVGISALRFNSSGEANTASGNGAMASNLTGSFNTSAGFFSLNKNIDGSFNTGVGSYSMSKNTSGKNNTAMGYNALSSNTTGKSNVAFGHSALYSNSTKSNNVAIGDSALYNNGIGATLIQHSTGNTAIGSKALFSNTTGNDNTASGNGAMASNLSGSFNTSTGYFSLNKNTDGSKNTVIGSYSMVKNTSGDLNTANGYSALFDNTTGLSNTAIGAYSLLRNIDGDANTALGFESLFKTLGSGNVAIGTKAGYNETGSNKLYIENSSSSTPLIGGDFSLDEIYLNGKVGIGTSAPDFNLHIKDNSASELLMIENTNTDPDTDGMIIKVGSANPTDQADFVIFQNYVGFILGTIEGNGSGGVNYTTSSDARLKTKIEDYNEALKTVNQIGIKKYERISNPGIEEIGVIAQELQKVYPQAVSGSPDSDVKTDPMMVDYSKLTPLLVKAVQEQQEMIKELVAEIEELKKVQLRN